jgi:hypothetical protein
MKKMYTTAMGKQIDFEGLKAVGEETIAVGNMKVNARGDQLGPGGTIQNPRNSAIADHYQIGGTESREDKLKRQQIAGAKTSRSKAVKKSNPTEDMFMQKENDQPSLSNNQDPTTTNEAETETFVPPDKKLRGNLADSMAKETTVVQEKMPDPRRPKGPTRI